jgi:hydrogenase small subunit
MPGFPDKFTPFYKKPPGSTVSTTMSRMVGTVIKPLRMYTNEHLNREVRWDLHGETPTGWARQRPEPGPLRETGHKVYDTLRRRGDRGKNKAPEWGKRAEWTEQEEPRVEEEQPPIPPGEGSSPAPPPSHDRGP